MPARWQAQAVRHGSTSCVEVRPPTPRLPVQEGRLFPLELEPFPSFEALQEHVAASHPHCDFCSRTFYDGDALWKHMHQARGRPRDGAWVMMHARDAQGMQL